LIKGALFIKEKLAYKGEACLFGLDAQIALEVADGGAQVGGRLVGLPVSSVTIT
jgi:hypothetical protein